MSASIAELPLTRLDEADPELLEELLVVTRQVAEAGAFTLGEHVEGFEADFAGYCDAAEAIGVSSGTSALELALRALGIGAGDEVVVPANSFIATAEAVSAVGATPRFADVDAGSLLLTAETVAAVLTPRVRCIIPVHLYGATVELEPILALAREHGAFVVEDACQAHGARLDGRRVGGLGNAGAFSFYPSKNLGAWGDGGAVVTNDPEVAERVRLLRSHGQPARYQHTIIGTTARLDGLQAALLRTKLRSLDVRTARRRRLGAELRQVLAGMPIELPEAVRSGGDHVHHLFVVRTDSRDALRAHLARDGIQTGLHYPTPLHLTEAYAHLGLRPGALPVVEHAADRVCSLPMFPAMTSGDIDRVAESVSTFDTAREAVAAVG